MSVILKHTITQSLKLKPSSHHLLHTEYHTQNKKKAWTSSKKKKKKVFLFTVFKSIVGVFKEIKCYLTKYVFLLN